MYVPGNNLLCVLVILLSDYSKHRRSSVWFWLVIAFLLILPSSKVVFLEGVLSLACQIISQLSCQSCVWKNKRAADLSVVQLLDFLWPDRLTCLKHVQLAAVYVLRSSYRNPRSFWLEDFNALCAWFVWRGCIFDHGGQPDWQCIALINTVFYWKCLIWCSNSVSVTDPVWFWTSWA